MQIFGIDLWRIVLCIILITLVIKRANIVAFFAKRHYANRNFEKAVKVFSIADKVGNMNVNNKSLYGYSQLRLGMVDEALVTLRGILPYTKPQTASRYQLKNLLALAYWKSGNLDEAIEEMEEIIDANYKTTVIFQNLGIFYNLKEDHERALRFNLSAYEYNSDDYIIIDNLAEAYANNGDGEKAKELYAELLSKEPEPHFPEPYYNYGELLIKGGERDRGIELIEKSLTKSFTFFSIKTKEEVEEILSKYK